MTRFPDRVFAFDQFGPLSIRPCHGTCWARTKHPDRLPATYHLVGTTARYRPGEAHLTVGGDWYDVTSLPDGQLAVAIGDIIGHGITAATAMGQLRSAAGALLTAGLAPADVLDHLDTIAARIPAARCSTACCAAHDARRPHRAPLVELGAVLAATHTATADALGVGPAGWP